MLSLVFIVFLSGMFAVSSSANRLSLLVSTACSASILALIYNLYLLYPEQWQVSYPWLKQLGFEIRIDLAFVKDNLQFIFSMSAISLFVLFTTMVYPSERSKNNLAGMVVFNLLAIMLLVSSQNYIQLMMLLGIIDIISFVAINDISAKKRYIYGNFIADMGLLSVFSVIIGQTSSIDIASVDLSEFAHNNYIVIVTLVCLFIKSGIFMFHNGLLESSSVSFNRLNFILFASSPLASFLVLLKLRGLLIQSSYYEDLLLPFSILSIIWGGYGAIVIDNIKRKSAYFAMSFWGAMFALTLSGNLDISYLLLGAFLFSQTLLMANEASSNVLFITEMGAFAKSLKFVFLLVIFFAAGYLVLLCNTHAFLYAVVFALAASQTIGQIYLGKTHADGRVWANLHTPSVVIWLPVLVFAIFVAYKNIEHFGLLILLFISITFLRPLRFLDKLYQKTAIQDGSYFTYIWELFLIMPLKVIGRILWLTVDFMFIEKTVISSISASFAWGIKIFNKMHSNRATSYILSLLLALIMVYITWRLRM